MSYPTLLGPWFVVNRFLFGDGAEQVPIVEYYQASEDGTEPLWTQDPKKALLFMSLHSAGRVNVAVGGMIRVLVTKDEAEEFGRG